MQHAFDKIAYTVEDWEANFSYSKVQRFTDNKMRNKLFSFKRAKEASLNTIARHVKPFYNFQE